ncbi:hypothetical protein [Hufsiella ginkgonis]|uniref:Uncharacterized protein n=1 Tax=Hufsiella ginkgonis TaxID=2695274 RepID=A0A7K1XZK2_9SPHI|nr:hypothetical protein [Hufsiella ginkgonis]MXV16238.1 hypothetical protein [Hufsiella ginkgonis]
MIYHRGSNLRMRVYCLGEEQYQSNPDELQFYADNNGELLAFETWHYDMDDPGLIIEAIRWYARYIKNPGMEILADDPRAGHNNSNYG